MSQGGQLQLEGILLDEVQGGETRRDEQCEGEGGWGGRKRYGDFVEQVDMDEENADDEYSYVLEKPLPAQGPGESGRGGGATWTSGFSRTGIGNLNHLEMIKRQVRNSALDLS